MTMAGSQPKGLYTKIGNVVYWSCECDTSSIGSANGSIRCKGLPFTNLNDSRAEAGISVGYASGLNITQYQGLTGNVGINASHFWFNRWNETTGTSTMQHDNWTDDGKALVSGFYRV
jgi:hypothetical protein